MQTSTLRASEIMFQDRGWSRAHATISFDDYPPAAPGFLPFGALRLAVIEEMDPGHGYPMHAHCESETIMIPLAGAIAHEDSVTGNAITYRDDVSVLSAGTGMKHSEMAHGSEKTRAVMFWLDSSIEDQPPRFAVKTFDRARRRNRFVALASGRSALASQDPAPLHVRSDSDVLAAMLDAGTRVAHEVAKGRRIYIVAPDGAIAVNGTIAHAGDRVLCVEPGVLAIEAIDATEVFLVDLPA